ncbi:hypothetical protein LSCM1_01828 [Leishmania martiniquensis]|uniref:Uncharacterized protein n=1 Tax=Leishmania martiniquensis TaxID=1580590 RepID=A0A836KBS6_9TRYP|nr:hypothetical protein LSCM1_01828 [Leishmania martiniquensis]
MSSARRPRSRNGKPAKAETYSRADEALWDDAYLLKLFNEQLGNSDAVKDTGDATPADDVSVVTTDTDISDREEGSVSDSAAAALSDASETDAQETLSRRSSKPAVAQRSFPTLNGLPDDIQALVDSFYAAGFEAGRYVGRSEVSKRASRKRHR